MSKPAMSLAADPPLEGVMSPMKRPTTANPIPTPSARARSLCLCLGLTAIAVGGTLLPLLLKSSFHLELLISATTLAIAALALGFLAHHCGLVMFGIAGFSGGGAYLFAIAVTQFRWNATPAAFFALCGTTALATLVGALIVRSRPLPFAMLTLALAQMLHSLVRITQYRAVTGGDDGLPLTFNGTIFGLSQDQLAKPEMFWPVAWLSLCAVMLITWFVGRSRTGKVLRAIQSNEERMRFSGFNTYAPRVLAFTITGAIAGLAGVLTALHAAFASPELLDFATGGNALVSMLVGGASNIVGPALGALLFVIGQDRFGSSGHLELLTGISVVVVIVAFPSGAMSPLVRAVQSRIKAP